MCVEIWSRRMPASGASSGRDMGSSAPGSRRGGKGILAHRAVFAAGDQGSTVGRERQGVDRLLVFLQCTTLDAVRGVPERDGLADREGQERAVRAEGDRPRPLVVARDGPLPL